MVWVFFIAVRCILLLEFATFLVLGVFYFLVPRVFSARICDISGLGCFLIFNSADFFAQICYIFGLSGVCAVGFEWMAVAARVWQAFYRWFYGPGEIELIGEGCAVVLNCAWRRDCD